MNLEDVKRILEDNNIVYEVLNEKHDKKKFNLACSKDNKFILSSNTHFGLVCSIGDDHVYVLSNDFDKASTLLTNKFYITWFPWLNT